MKAPCYILLVLVILLQSGGGLPFFKLQQLVHRWQTRSAMEKNAVVLEKILLSQQEYEQGKMEDNEIRLNGEMYDVKEVKECNGKVELTVARDKEEDSILRRILAIADEDEESQKEFPTSLIEMLTMVFVLPGQVELQYFHAPGKPLYMVYSIDVCSRHSNEIDRPPSMLM